MPSWLEARAWPLRLERRARPSTAARVLAAPLAVVALAAVGFVLLVAGGERPAMFFDAYFVQPFDSWYGVGEWLLRATPLLLCASGLALGYRANVWNIGAEGQFIAGALAGGGVALHAGPALGHWVMPSMLVAGVLGGMAWAAIPAWLRTRFHASEIVVSLMLVYIAQLLLGYLVHGPWRDPAGHNFPQSAPFTDAELLRTWFGTRLTVGFAAALMVAWLAWWFGAKTALGFRLRVGGLAPAAARYAGISDTANVWWAMLIGGGAAGFAGILEVAGPVGMLQPVISPGYGFTAIIVAFVGRLQPLGIVLAALLMAALYLGGESAQIELQIPASVTGLFQALLLFFMLAAEVFVTHRVRRV